MNAESAISRLREVIRLKHLSLSTESTYVGWVVRYMDAVVKMPSGLTSEHDGLPHGHTMQRGIPAGVYRIFIRACSRSGSNSRLKYSAACSGVMRSNRLKSRVSLPL